MKRGKSRGKVEVPAPKVRNFNPHNRNRVIPNKHKVYNRKARTHDRREPFDF